MHHSNNLLTKSCAGNILNTMPLPVAAGNPSAAATTLLVIECSFLLLTDFTLLPTKRVLHNHSAIIHMSPQHIPIAKVSTHKFPASENSWHVDFNINCWFSFSDQKYISLKCKSLLAVRPIIVGPPRISKTCDLLLLTLKQQLTLSHATFTHNSSHKKNDLM